MKSIKTFRVPVAAAVFCLLALVACDDSSSGPATSGEDVGSDSAALLSSEGNVPESSSEAEKLSSSEFQIESSSSS